jgi:hypothetical protein
LNYSEPKKVEETIGLLVSKNLLNTQEGFYFLGSDEKVERRLKGNAKAKTKIRTARKFSRLISGFPFVRAVWISGSLSKGYLGPNDDIDYFIVTKPGRLWLTRTLLTLFKKIFLLNSYKNFCINYFVDTNNLQIKEHNLYQATETLFMLPLINANLFKEFIEINNWVFDFYPNYQINIQPDENKQPLLKRLLEKMLSGRVGSSLESMIYKRSERIIRKKYSLIDTKTFESNFYLTEGELRYFPGSRTADIMEKLDLKIQKYCQDHQLNSLKDLDKL